MIGLLEIIAGEMETGVTRFIAVSVKTFVLCLGSSLGMMLVVDSPHDVWQSQAGNCGQIDLNSVWWRVPLYLLCSASVLGQYRFPIVDYWRGLIVQLVAYETQYQVQLYYEGLHAKDNMDNAASNVVGATAAVVGATILSFVVDFFRHHYYAQILHRKSALNSGRLEPFGRCIYAFCAAVVRCGTWLHLGRASENIKLNLRNTLRSRITDLKASKSRKLELAPEEEEVYVETQVSAENLSVWSILMPAIYQLVPGSMIAKLWFNSIFPPSLVVDGVVQESYEQQSNVFANLFVISASLALGMLFGFAIVGLLNWCLVHVQNLVSYGPARHTPEGKHRASVRARVKDRFAGMFHDAGEDPQANDADASSVEDADEALAEIESHTAAQPGPQKQVRVSSV